MANHYSTYLLKMENDRLLMFFLKEKVKGEIQHMHWVSRENDGKSLSLC